MAFRKENNGSVIHSMHLLLHLIMKKFSNDCQHNSYYYSDQSQQEPLNYTIITIIIQSCSWQRGKIMYTLQGVIGFRFFSHCLKNNDINSLLKTAEKVTI